MAFYPVKKKKIIQKIKILIILGTGNSSPYISIY
jgi:hypothetical protein